MPHVTLHFLLNLNWAYRTVLKIYGKSNWTVYWAAMSYCIFLHILFHLISKITLWGRHYFSWEVIGLDLQKMKISQLCPTLCDHMDYTVRGILQARILWRVAFPSPRDLPNPGIEPRSPALQADSLPAEPLGKPKNTAVGSLSLLQGIFPSQESNRGLLHCRRILY